MTLGIFKDQLSGATFMICILAIPITTLATVFRFLGTRRSGRKIDLEDWLALLALVSFWLHAATALWTVIILNGRDRFRAGELPPWQIVQMSQVGYVMQLNFPFNPTFAKLSLLALYFRIFSANPMFKRWVWILVVLQICWFLAIFLCRIMFCLPIQKVWHMETMPGTCVDPSLLLAAGESVNAAIAFAMIGLAMWMVRTLSMSPRSKWKLRVLFVLGGMTGVIDIVSIAEAYGKITLNLIYLCLVTLQMAVNSICCCAPVYKTIIPDMPWVSRLKSKVSVLYGSKTSKSGGEESQDYPQRTLVTIGGTVVKRKGGGPEQEWVPLKDSGMPNMGWADAMNTTDVETGPRGRFEELAWEGGPGQHGQNVHVQRTFQVT